MTTVGSLDATTSADLLITDPISQCPKIALEKGAAAHIEDTGLEIESIEPATQPAWSGRPMRSNRKMWEIDVRLMHPESRVSLWPVLPLDADGLPIYVDAQGKPVAANEVYRKTMESRARTQPRPGQTTWAEPPYQEARIFAGGVNRSIVSFHMNIDPKYVPHLYVQAQRAKIVRLTDIHLDPKRSIIQ
jgi:hypothetical protein